jgi:hypothetical protein
MSGKEVPDQAQGGLMFSRTVSRILLASASALAIGGALATPALAQGNPVAPQQYYYGEVFGTASNANPDVILVNCAGPATTGHPASGQSVAAHQIFPPVPTTAGYTGTSANEIAADLAWPTATGTPVHVGEILFYDTTVSIPTSITVPCSGSGVAIFTPSPDTGGTPSYVNVTFVSPGV